MNTVNERVAGIILAAGASTRMGEPKQLLSAGGQTLLGRVLNEALRSHLDKVFLVLGHRSDEIKRSMGRALKEPGIRVVENRRYEQGISSSIIAGLREARKDHDHVMIILADMPNMNVDIINRLLHRYLESGLPLGAVKIGEKRSHPVVFGRGMYDELLGLKGDVGARDLFRKYAERVCLVEPEVPYDDMDIDTPEDYSKLAGSLDEG
jgi:molybdenum cofactor cytidylyltransferase